MNDSELRDALHSIEHDDIAIRDANLIVNAWEIRNGIPRPPVDKPPAHPFLLSFRAAVHTLTDAKARLTWRDLVFYVLAFATMSGYMVSVVPPLALRAVWGEMTIGVLLGLLTLAYLLHLFVVVPIITLATMRRVVDRLVA